MQKVYLLLRSNKQTGPYTRDELLELKLKPLDLIWVEGKSFGWSYPSEIESLKAFIEAPVEEESQKPPLSYENLKASNNTSTSIINKKIFVSMPQNGANTSGSTSKSSFNSLEQQEELNQKNNGFNPPVEPEYDHKALERKADELKQRAQAYTSSRPAKNEDELVEVKYAKTLEEVEDDYTSWVYQKKIKKKKFNPKEQMLSVLAVIVVVAGGWFIGSRLFNEPTKNAEHVVHVQNSEREDIKPVITEVSDEEDIRYDIVEAENQVNKTTVPKSPVEEKQLPVKPGIIEVEKNDLAFEPMQENKLPESSEKPIFQSNEEPVANAEQPKKKTLGESVSEVFRKLIKDDDAETKSEPAKGERKSSRRSETVTAETDISDQVEIKMNSNSDNWMMGVIGLKLTLFNKSNLPVKTAIIEVLYFNDQDKLLDKKRITFSNIAPKKSQTISAPDHRLADRAEIKMISATGIEDAYAKN